ncbi:DUF551 domain-containing protein [Enterobacter cloacae]|uniref:DUF551 domain-containing protein n=1 Tax=Enterobacter cloacae TaxID=550 RepID=UPI00338DC1DE
MSTITKEQAQSVSDLKAGYTLGHADVAILNELARIALASLEAEAVGEVVLGEYDDCGCHPDARVVCIAADGQADWENFKDGTRLYTAPPVPVSVPECLTNAVSALELLYRNGQKQNWNERYTTDMAYASGVLKACRAAMLQVADQATVKQPSSNSVLGWLRADYQDDNRGLRGNAPLFVLGKKDPSSVWGLDYIPLTAKSPVIPDGWVACSERMPEKFKAILAFNEYGEVWSGAYDRYWNFYCDNLLVEHVTHWMPLPVAPKPEVK